MCECVCVRERDTDSEFFLLRSRGSKRESFLQNNFDYIRTVCVDVCMYVCACERVTRPELFRLCLRGTCVCARVFVCVGESDFPESFRLRWHGMCVCVHVCVCVRESDSFRLISMNALVCRFGSEMATHSEYSQLGSQGACVFVRIWERESDLFIQKHLDYDRTVRVCVCACFCVCERVGCLFRIIWIIIVRGACARGRDTEKVTGSKSARLQLRQSERARARRRHRERSREKERKKVREKRFCWGGASKFWEILFKIKKMFWKNKICLSLHLPPLPSTLPPHLLHTQILRCCDSEMSRGGMPHK